MPAPRILPVPVSPYVQAPRAPGDVIPHTYMVFGLRTGPGGMAFTDQNGAAVPVPSNPQIVLKPFMTSPPLPQTFTLPLPAPKK